MHPPANENANDLATAHLHLVQHVLNQLATRLPRHVDRSELWSAGAQGLVDAARRYDPGTGVPFATYASVRVRGAMIDATRQEDLASRGVRRRMRELDAERQRLEQELGATPSTLALAERLGSSVEEIERLQARAAAATVLRLDQPLRDGESDAATFGDQLTGDDAETPETELEQNELLGMMRTAMAHLPEVQREVLHRHYFGGELFRDIAATLGVTEARVSQLRAEALNALRAFMESQAVEGLPAVPEGAPGARRRAAYLAEMQALSSWREMIDAGTRAEAIA